MRFTMMRARKIQEEKEEGSVVNINNEIMKPQEVADLIGINISTVYSKAANDEIPSRKKLGKRYFLRSEIMKFLRQK